MLVSSIEYTSLRIASPDKLIQSILERLNVSKAISFRISETSAGLQVGALETCNANKHLGQWQAGGRFAPGLNLVSPGIVRWKMFIIVANP